MPQNKDVNINNKEDLKLIELLSKGRLSDKTVTNLSVVMAKALPIVLKRLLEENQALRKANSELKDHIENGDEKLRAAFKEALVSSHLDERQLEALPHEARTLLRDYISSKKTNLILSENLENLTSDIKTLAYVLQNNELHDLDLVSSHSHQEVINLKHVITSKIRSLSKAIVKEIEDDIAQAIKTGNYSHLLETIMKEINVLIVERMSEFVKPYDDLSQRYVKGEITHEHFTENLQRSALIQHLREKVIDDIIVAIETNNLSSHKVPVKLKHAIEKIIKNNELMYNTDLQSLLNLNFDNEDEAESFLKDDRDGDSSSHQTKRPHMLGRVI